MIEIRTATGPSDWAQARALLLDYVGWLREAVGVEPLEVQPSFALELDDLAGTYTDPDTTFMVAAKADRVVGTMATVRHPDGSTELKRLYVSPTARGLGAGDRLVAAAVADAASHGAGRLWLETLSGVMDQAIALYHRHGFAIAPGRGRTGGVAGVIVMERRAVPLQAVG